MTRLPIVSSSPLSGGVRRARLADDREVICKRGQGAGATFTEAASLRWLAAAEAVPIPEVIAVDEDLLVIEALDLGTPSETAAARFGENLAHLHDSGAPAFGSPPPGGATVAWIGNAEMLNHPASEWPQWFADTRIRPYLRGVSLPAVEQVCERIGEFAGPAQPPARVHGDLWNGNVFWSATDEVWLIDPAAHGGHPETDLAMLALFGCPHLDTIIRSYQRVHPLTAGWRDRVAVHQLFPLLVHATLFGGGYAREAERLATLLLRAT